MVCIRRAWLELDGTVIALEDTAAGYACTELDLGFPEIRDQVDNRPDADGVIDRTTLAGARNITANIKTLGGGGAMSADEISTLFAPYMLPRLRPELHYVLDRPGTPERVVTVRAADYSWPISGSAARDVQLSWVAADPWMTDPSEHSATAYAGTGGLAGGRRYPLAFPRLYPAGGGSPTTGVIQSAGDVPVQPLVRIYGPITDPAVGFQVANADGPNRVYALVFTAGFRIDPGHWVDADTATKTVTSDAGTSAMGDLDWMASEWPVLPVAPGITYMTLTGTSTTTTTQAVATWQDGYLT